MPNAKLEGISESDMHMTETETHKAKKAHRCDWCWQRIEPAEQYKRYRWFGSGGAVTVKMHPECHDAMQEAAEEEGGYIEWTPGQERPQPSNVERSAAGAESAQTQGSASPSCED